MHPSGLAVFRVLRIAALATFLVTAGCASANRSDDGETKRAADYARSGPYVGLYGIESYEHFQLSNDRVRVGHSDLGAGLKFGYRASPHVAVELIAESVKGFRIAERAARSNLDLLNFGFMGKYYFMTERFQPYAVAGVGLARSDVRNFDYDHDGGFLRGGLGADFYLTTNFALFAEANYNRMMGGVSDLHHADLQVGVIFRF